jgi:hypothetical protein
MSARLARGLAAGRRRRLSAPRQVAVKYEQLYGNEGYKRGVRLPSPRRSPLLLPLVPVLLLVLVLVLFLIAQPAALPARPPLAEPRHPHPSHAGAGRVNVFAAKFSYF